MASLLGERVAILYRDWCRRSSTLSGLCRQEAYTEGVLEDGGNYTGSTGIYSKRNGLIG